MQETNGTSLPSDNNFPHSKHFWFSSFSVCLGEIIPNRNHDIIVTNSNSAPLQQVTYTN